MTISARFPLGYTGSICLKSPPKTTTFPPKGRSSVVFIMSRRLRSRDSKQCLLIIVENSSGFIGMSNLECAVLPPGSNNATISLEATLSITSPLDRTAA
ncbi:hypothetical protein N665_0914s0017 [Sinapis alba]|nr:hypothetical protein N665_0914s0017 [Sinapis alba]